MAFREPGTSLLGLLDNEPDVIAVRLLFSKVLSRSTSVPLVEVLDKEAMSHTRSPGACPHHMWQVIVIPQEQGLCLNLKEHVKTGSKVLKWEN